MRRLLVLTLLLLRASTMRADVPCEAAYTTLRDALAERKIPVVIRMKLDTNAKGAWRAYLAGSRKGLKSAERHTDAALAVLAGSPQLVVTQRENLAAKVDDLRKCFDGAAPIETGTAVITVVHAYPAPPAAGAIIRVSGLDYGVTGEDGVATLTIPAADVAIEAIDYPAEIGFARVSVPRGGTAAVKLLLDEGKHVCEDSIAVVDERFDGVLPSDFASLTLSFRRDEAPVSLHFLDAVGVPDGIDYWAEDLTELFRVENGRIEAVDVAGFRRVLQAHGGKLTLWLDAYDTDGRRHCGLVDVVIVRHPVDCRLLAPPSRPDLPVAGLTVRAATLDKSFASQAVSGQDGTLHFPALPDGNVRFSCETIHGGRIYYGDAIIELTGPTLVKIVVRNVEDVLHGVLPYSFETLETQVEK